MALVSTILYGITIFSFLLGNLWRINLNSLSIPLIDICLVLVSILIVWQQRSNITKTNLLVLVFLFLTFINLFIQSYFGGFELVPFLYWLRFSLWFFVIFFKPEKLIPTNLIIVGLIFFIFIGFFQYFFYPDLRPLTGANWDPHLYRLVGSLLDPAFTGLCLLMTVVFLVTQPRLYRFQPIIIIFAYLAFALTYSRSTFLSLVVFSLYYSRKISNIRFFIFTIFLVLATLFLLPRPAGEGTKLERTSTIKAKIVNYHQAITLLTNYPLTGVGYNRIGLYRPQEKPGSHARWGFDNSFLNIANGNGLPLFFFFIFLLLKLWNSSSLGFKSLLMVVFTHSFFSNSLVYPQVMALLLMLKYRK